MPLNDTSKTLQVNWLSIEIVRKHNGKVTYRNSFVTSSGGQTWKCRATRSVWQGSMENRK